MTTTGHGPVPEATEQDGRRGAQPGDGPVRVLYVGGQPRSGSTLLDLMLGQLPRHCDVGELYYLWRAGVRGDRLCACGEPFSACPFWSEVGRVAFGGGGWDAVDVDEVLALQAAVDRTARIPMMLAARFVPSFRRSADRYGAILAALYRGIAEISGAEVVVDSTKQPSLAYLLRRSPGVDLAVVHVVRDPRGVAYSWSKQVALPAGAGARGYLRTRSPVQVVRRWMTGGLLFELLARLGVPTVLVRYEDLVRDPRPLLVRAAALHDVDLTDAPLGFLTPGGLAPGTSHAVAGGRVRFRSGQLPLRLDEEWRRALPARKRWAVGAATLPLRRRYGYR